MGSGIGAGVERIFSERGVKGEIESCEGKKGEIDSLGEGDGFRIVISFLSVSVLVGVREMERFSVIGGVAGTCVCQERHDQRNRILFDRSIFICLEELHVRLSY
ncbi:hypothetical protein Dimus_011703 [Dionaea muscipula]